MTIRLVQGFEFELDNKPGTLHNITRELASRGVNIAGLSAATQGGTGFIGLVTDNDLETRHILREAGLKVQPVEYLAVSTANQPGALDSYLTQLADAGVNVTSMFPMAGAEATIAIGVDDPERVRVLVEELEREAEKLQDLVRR